MTMGIVQNKLVNNDVEKTLGQTGLGVFILKNKAVFILLIATAILIIIGRGVFLHLEAKDNSKNALVVFNFEKDIKSEFVEERLDASTYMAKFKDLNRQLGNFKGLFLLVLDTTDIFLNKDDNVNAKEALNLLERFNKYDEMAPFISFRKAVYLENTGDIDGAISILQASLNNSFKVLEDKTYLDLGRLYKIKKETNKAKNSLQYVIDNTVDDSLRKMARVYISEL